MAEDFTAKWKLPHAAMISYWTKRENIFVEHEEWERFKDKSDLY